MAASLTVLFFPLAPTLRSVAEKVCRHLGYRVVCGSSLLQADIGFYWDTHTWRAPAAELLDRANTLPILNMRCVDFSKRHVDRVFEQLAGRSLRVDPRTSIGAFVVKSDANAAHDGVVTEGPLTAVSPHFVYQALVNNQVDPATVVDLRTPVYGGEIPIVYRLYRPLTSRFSVDDTAAAIAEPSEVFTETELDLLRRFADAIGMDCGELDVLRDRDSGLIWVVDANPTPWGPPRQLPAADAVVAMKRLAKAFERLALDASLDHPVDDH